MSTVADPFAFLSPAAAEGAVLRTPMERNHAAAGAEFEDRDGWRVADYPSNGEAPAWAADISHHGKIDVRGPHAEIDRLSAGLELGKASHVDGVWTLRLSPSHAVVLCPFSRVEQLRTRIASESEAICATDMTCGWAGVMLGGERVRDVFMRSSSLDVRPHRFPAGACMAGSVMRCGSIILNDDGRVLGALRLGVRGVHVGVAARCGGDARHHPGVGHGRPAQRGAGMIGLLKKHRYFRDHDLKSSYDVVIIGAGAHGLATAYYLAKRHGIKKIAVLDRSYMGAGASGRNTTIIRSNYLTPEGARFYEASVKLYESLSQELNFNMLFSQHGHLTLAHSDRSVNTMMERAEVNRLVGVDSRVVYPDEIKDLCPQLDISDHPTFPILAALYHPPGGVIRHDAVVWGYGKEADKMGVEIHQYTDVTGINVENGKVTGVETNRGTINCDTVISCVAGWSTLVCDLVGVPLPLTTHILQACVTEPVKPLLDKIIVSGTLHIYISQSDRGEFVMGSEIEPYSGYSNTSTFRFIEDLAMHMIELLPMLGHAKILRQWTGYCDVSPDYSPIMGLTEVEGFIIDAGWGTYGFKASPIVGFTIADLIGTGKIPDLIQPFRWARFYENDLVSERGAAAVSH